MRRFISRISTIGAGLLIPLALPFVAAAQTNPNSNVNSNNTTSNNNAYTVTPWTYVGAAGDCGTGYPAGSKTYGQGANVVSRWVNDMGNPSPSLYLQKFAPTTDCSSAGATINGVSGITLTELNFDYYSADTNAHCGAGAPRFNVITSDNVTHFFGCADGTATDLGNGWTHVTFDPANTAQAFPIVASGVTVKSIDIVFDEQGYTHLDNISVNSQTIGHGSTPWKKSDCKNGGYKNFADNQGNFFTNQGQCVSFVEHNQHQLFKSSKDFNVPDIVQHATAATNNGGNSNSTKSVGTY